MIEGYPHLWKSPYLSIPDHYRKSTITFDEIPIEVPGGSPYGWGPLIAEVNFYVKIPSAISIIPDITTVEYTNFIAYDFSTIIGDDIPL
jgi:hypothetical protein